MDEIDNLSLHYAMLEYLYDNHKLSTSCFSHAWEDFTRENADYSHLTATELKTIFWTEIAQNLEQHPEMYFLLTEQQLEYFDPEEFPLEHNNELLQSVLEHNEPKAGVDFTFYRSASAYENANQTIRQQNPDEMMETIKKAFANPTLYTSVFDDVLTEVDEEDTRINVIAQKPMMEIDTGEDPLEIFKEMLLTLNDIEAGKTELTDDEVYERLADDDFNMDFDDLPEGLQYYLKKTGDTVLYKAPPTKSRLDSPRPTTSTPLVGSPPSFIRTRSRSMMSEIVKDRRMLFQNLDSNVQKSPKSSRHLRRALYPSKSDTTLTNSSSK